MQSFPRLLRHVGRIGPLLLLLLEPRDVAFRGLFLGLQTVNAVALREVGVQRMRKRKADRDNSQSEDDCASGQPERPMRRGPGRPHGAESARLPAGTTASWALDEPTATVARTAHG